MSGPEVFGTNPYVTNRIVDGEVVTVLTGTTDRRGLYLGEYRSRTVTAGQVHELMVTDEEHVEPGSSPNRVALIGFFVVKTSGVLLVGADVSVSGRSIGTIAGFDDTHMPNHQNICLSAIKLKDGVELRIEVGDQVVIGK